MPTVSIIIINHNYGEFLDLAVESALSQSLPVEQVIVVDDGSIDSSRSVILSYGERILPILKIAGGHVSAVNHGFAASTSQLCIFLDADDFLYPTCNETIQKIWNQGDVKLQYRLDTVDRLGNDQHMPFPHISHELTPSEVRLQSFRFGTYPWTVSSGNVYSRGLLEALLPIDQGKIYRSPDGYLNKMAPLFGDVRSTSAVLGVYRVHGSNAWAQEGRNLKIEPVLRWLKFDTVLQSEFENIAKDRGIEVCTDRRIRTLQQSEYHLIAARFSESDHIKMIDLLQLLIVSIRSSLFAPNTSAIGKAVWSCWFLCLCVLPRSWIKTAFGAARAQTGRSLISRFLVYLSRR